MVQLNSVHRRVAEEVQDQQNWREWMGGLISYKIFSAVMPYIAILGAQSHRDAVHERGTTMMVAPASMSAPSTPMVTQDCQVHLFPPLASDERGYGLITGTTPTFGIVFLACTATRKPSSIFFISAWGHKIF